MVKVTSHLWFADGAEEAVRLYTGLVPGSSMGPRLTIPTDTPSGPAGSVYQIEFSLGGQNFLALNAGPLDPFNHAYSIVLECDSQAEIDRLWEALLEGGEAEQCGWLRDRYGLCWQIIPKGWQDMMSSPDTVAVKRAADAMLTMVKFDVAKLEAAFAGG